VPPEIRARARFGSFPDYCPVWIVKLNTRGYRTVVVSKVFRVVVVTPYGGAAGTVVTVSLRTTPLFSIVRSTVVVVIGTGTEVITGAGTGALSGTPTVSFVVVVVVVSAIAAPAINKSVEAAAIQVLVMTTVSSEPSVSVDRSLISHLKTNMVAIGSESHEKLIT
jgi:hypothetical protein